MYIILSQTTKQQKHRIFEMRNLKKTKKEILKNSIALFFHKKQGLQFFELDYEAIEKSIRSDLDLNFDNEKYGNLLCDSFTREGFEFRCEWFDEADFDAAVFHIDSDELKDLFASIDKAESDEDFYKIIDDLFKRFDHYADDFFESVEQTFVKEKEMPLPSEMLPRLEDTLESLYYIQSNISSSSFSKNIESLIDNLEEIKDLVNDFDSSYEQMADDKDTMLSMFSSRNTSTKDLFKIIIDSPHLSGSTIELRVLNENDSIEKKESSEMFDLFLKNKDIIMSILKVIDQKNI